MSATDKKVACSSFLTPAEDPLEESVTSTVALRYDTVHDYFVYTYKAPQYGCYLLGIRRADGLTAKQWRFLFVP
jgi:hypothetical protein